MVDSWLLIEQKTTNIDDNYSTWSEIPFDVPQGSILWPLLFNNFLAELYFIVNDVDIASYTDGSTPFIAEDNTENLIASLEESSNALFNYFKNSRLKSNPGKCDVLVNTNKHLNSKTGDYKIGNTEFKKQLGVKITVNLNFNNHISDLTKKATRKVSALARVTPFMSFDKKKLLIWMTNLTWLISNFN